MLIRFIKQNRALAVFFPPFALIILWISGFIHPSIPSVEYATPIYKGLISRLESIPLVLSIIALLLVLLEAIFVNFLVRRAEIMDATTFMPAFLYVVLMSLQPNMLMLHPMVIANLFLCLAVYKLMQTYKQDTAYSEIFDASLFISLAAIIYMPSVIYLLLIWIALIIIRPFIWREWIISLIGFSTPWIFVLFYYFRKDILSEFPTDYLHNTLVLTIESSRKFKMTAANYFQFAILILTTLLTIVNLLGSFRKSTVRQRNNLLLLLYFSILSVIIFFIAPAYDIVFLSSLSIPFAIFIANYFLSTSKYWVAELLLLLLVISIFINRYFQ